eukprot:4853173-Pyramimonas_sp.AAC.1
MSSPNEPTAPESAPESQPAAGRAARGAAGGLGAATRVEGPIPSQLDLASAPKTLRSATVP